MTARGEQAAKLGSLQPVDPPHRAGDRDALAPADLAVDENVDIAVGERSDPFEGEPMVLARRVVLAPAADRG